MKTLQLWHNEITIKQTDKTQIKAPKFTMMDYLAGAVAVFKLLEYPILNW